MLFHLVQAFSRTLWNALTFPAVFQEAMMSDTKERTLAVLWGLGPRARVSQTLTTGAEASQWRDVVRQVYEFPQNRGSFIDGTGLFRGVPNEQVAEEILAHNGPKAKAIAYYNDEDELVVLSFENGKKVIEPIATSQYRKNKDALIVYWDQQHTVGSDVKLGISATAVVSFGQQTLMRDLLQELWRMRQLHLGQGVSFVVQESDRQVITNVLEEVFGEASNPLSLIDLVRYAEYYEAIRRGDHNFRALKNKLNALYMKGLVEKWNADPENAIEDAKGQGAVSLFSTERDPHPSVWPVPK